MKNLKFIIIAVLVTLPLAYYACDDSGQEPVFIPKGQITFTHTNLKTLARDVDGYYQLWLRLDSAGTRYYSLGEFNIAANGSIVNLLWQPMTFKLPPNLDTNSLGYSAHAIVSVENSLVSTPSNRRLISGTLIVGPDSIYGDLTLAGQEALGIFGTILSRPPLPPDNARYILYTPSNNESTCKQGAWFCDSSGNTSYLPDSLEFPSNFGWVYEGWIEDNNNPSNPQYYSMGRFFNPYAADFDGAGPCRGPGNGFDKPGQDFIQLGGSCPTITNLASGIYGIFITLEPASETPADTAYFSPFYLKLFYQDFISPSHPCKREDNIFNRYTTFPKGRLKITN